MFDFLYQEEFWMDALVQTIIAAIGGIVGGTIGPLIYYNNRLHNIADDILDLKKHKDLSKEHKDLSKEHEGLSKEHEDLSKEHEGLSKEHDQIKTVIADNVSLLSASVNENKEITRTVKEMFLEDRAKYEFQYGNLTEKQKDIIDSVGKLNNFATEMRNLQEERNCLVDENRELKVENRVLKEQCLHYSQLLSELAEERTAERSNDMEL